MGIETLNNAARAAGFAMAGTDEIFEERKVDQAPVSPESVALVPVVTPVRRQGVTEWVRSHLGSFGRRAPASPA